MLVIEVNSKSNKHFWNLEEDTTSAFCMEILSPTSASFQT